jgi:hypothetical protein
MISKPLLSTLLIFAVSPACGRTASPGDTRTSSAYVLDFTPSAAGGAYVGKMINLAFTIDVTQPVRELNVPSSGGARSEYVVGSDLVSCEERAALAVESSVASLATGTTAAVETLEIQLLPESMPGIPWKGGACYGYRGADGRWSWNFDVVPLIFDSEANVWRTTLSINQPSVDALKVVFSRDVPHLRLTKATYYAKH